MAIHMYDTKELVSILKQEATQTNSYVAALDTYMEMRLLYRSAADEVETKLNIINRELNYRPAMEHKYAIHTIQSRIKTMPSLVKKLERRQLDFSKDIIMTQLFDIAGVRVICSYVDDIYLVLDALSQQSDVTVVEIKDYIKHPKPNGYRSLHAIVQIPVFFLQKTEHLNVEIQFRTIAMDYWASLEHTLRYKSHDHGEDVAKRLGATSHLIEQLEEDMLGIRHTIESNEKQVTSSH